MHLGWPPRLLIPRYFCSTFTMDLNRYGGSGAKAVPTACHGFPSIRCFTILSMAWPMPSSQRVESGAKLCFLLLKFTNQMNQYNTHYFLLQFILTVYKWVLSVSPKAEWGGTTPCPFLAPHSCPKNVLGKGDEWRRGWWCKNTRYSDC